MHLPRAAAIILAVLGFARSAQAVDIQNGVRPSAGCTAGAVEVSTCGDAALTGLEQCESGACCDDTCMVAAAGTSCDDSAFCNDEERCDTSAACAPAEAPACADEAVCDEAARACADSIIPSEPPAAEDDGTGTDEPDVDAPSEDEAVSEADAGTQPMRGKEADAGSEPETKGDGGCSVGHEAGSNASLVVWALGLVGLGMRRRRD